MRKLLVLAVVAAVMLAAAGAFGFGRGASAEPVQLSLQSWPPVMSPVDGTSYVTFEGVDDAVQVEVEIDDDGIPDGGYGVYIEFSFNFAGVTADCASEGAPNPDPNNPPPLQTDTRFQLIGTLDVVDGKGIFKTEWPLAADTYCLGIALTGNPLGFNTRFVSDPVGTLIVVSADD